MESENLGLQNRGAVLLKWLELYIYYDYFFIVAKSAATSSMGHSCCDRNSIYQLKRFKCKNNKEFEGDSQKNDKKFYENLFVKFFGEKTDQNN